MLIFGHLDATIRRLFCNCAHDRRVGIDRNRSGSSMMTPSTPSRIGRSILAGDPSLEHFQVFSAAGDAQ
jgi:hypothetical protein